MNISGIRTYAGFYDYNTIKNSELISLPVQEVEPAGTLDAAKEDADRQSELIAVENGTKNHEPDKGAMEYASKYQPDVTYDLKGADSDMAGLDVEKALSQMKKDQVLQQYQFFVGESRAGENLESNLRMNEDFSL